MKSQALTLLLVAAVASGAAAAAPHAHQHGAIALAVAIDGEQLSIEMEAPLDSLLGFERAPRTDAERRAAGELLTRLRSGAAALFKADAAAQCTLVNAEVRASVLEPAAKTAAAKDEHADLDAGYTFKCAQPGQLRTLEVGLFDAFKRIRRIEVQVAGPKGQRKLTLARPARSIELQR
jgi:hypothetical protein